MHVHIALYKWKPTVTAEQVSRILAEVEALADKIPGIVEISTGENTSPYSEGYTHVILVRGESQEAIEAYRSHPDHTVVAAKVEALEEAGIGVDLETK